MTFSYCTDILGNVLFVTFRPLHRMAFGMVVASFAFVLAGFVQLQVERHAVAGVSPGKVDLRLVNLETNCDLRLTTSASSNHSLAEAPALIGQSSSIQFDVLTNKSVLPTQGVLQYGGQTQMCGAAHIRPGLVDLSARPPSRAMLVFGWWQPQHNRAAAAILPQLRTKNRQGQSLLRSVGALPYLRNAVLYIGGPKGTALRLNHHQGPKKDFLYSDRAEMPSGL